MNSLLLSRVRGLEIEVSNEKKRRKEFLQRICFSSLSFD